MVSLKPSNMSQSRGDEGQVHDLTDDKAGSPKARKRPAPEHRSSLQRGFLLSPPRPAAKKTKPRGALWRHFRRGERKNQSHYWAFCVACEAAAAALACPDRISVAAVAGVNDTMAKHLIRCPHAGEDAKAEARDADDDLDAPDGKKLNFPAGKVQSTLHKVPMTDMPSSAEEQRSFEQCLLKATVSANLPFQWINNHWVQEAFRMCREWLLSQQPAAAAPPSLAQPLRCR